MTTTQAIRLTPQEWRIAAETARGCPLPLIADNLGITEQEVVKCRINMRHRLGLNTDEELSEWYKQASGEDLQQATPRHRTPIDVVATMTSKGQITLPKEVRDHFRLQTGDMVRFFEDERGVRFGRQVREWPTEWPGLIPLPDGMAVDEYIEQIRGR